MRGRKGPLDSVGTMSDHGTPTMLSRSWTPTPDTAGAPLPGIPAGPTPLARKRGARSHMEVAARRCPSTMTDSGCPGCLRKLCYQGENRCTGFIIGAEFGGMAFINADETLKGTSAGKRCIVDAFKSHLQASLDRLS